MMELKQLCEKLIEIFELNSMSELSDRLLSVCKKNQTEYMQKFVNTIEDLSVDWLQKIFQYYEADRKEKMQDYTPRSLAKFVGKLTETENERTVFDLCAGSGTLTIQKWTLNHELSFVCYEYDKKVIPFLLFNLAIRNINALVINGDALREEVFTQYEVKCGEKYGIVTEIEETVYYKATDSCISNPPYNMKWKMPPFAQIQPRFVDFSLPPESNANYAFVLSGLHQVKDKAVFILPRSVMESSQKKEELEIRKELIEQNLIEAVILCPENMFEMTKIGTTILVLNRNKDTTHIELVDMRKVHDVEIREQRGQYGGASKENRVYKKEVNVFSDKQIERALSAIKEKKNENDFCRNISIEEVREHNYRLTSGEYFEIDMENFSTPHREYGEIIDDLNHVIAEKNGLKLTANEKIAKDLGLYDIFLLFKESEETNESMNKMLEFTNKKIENENFIAMSKKAGELKFENGSKEKVSTILLSILQMWKQHMMYLNNEENRYLVELRNALLPDLMSGKIEL